MEGGYEWNVGIRSGWDHLVYSSLPSLPSGIEVWVWVRPWVKWDQPQAWCGALWVTLNVRHWDMLILAWVGMGCVCSHKPMTASGQGCLNGGPQCVWELLSCRVP